MSHHRIEMKDVSFAYPDGTPGISGVSFLFRHGEAIGIIGANGAGKSTLLMLLLGLLFPQSGDVSVGDVPVTKNTLPSIRKSAGLVMQNSDDQLFMTTVYDDVAFGPRNEGLPEEEVLVRVKRALQAVGLSGFEKRAPYKLSGGEKKAVAIATVLSMEPDILLMDEPTSGLDPAAKRRLVDLLKGFEHTKMITSHDLDMFEKTCSRVIVMHKGRIAADGTPEEILRDENRLISWDL